MTVSLGAEAWVDRGAGDTLCGPTLIGGYMGGAADALGESSVDAEGIRNSDGEGDSETDEGDINVDGGTDIKDGEVGGNKTEGDGDGNGDTGDEDGEDDIEPSLLSQSFSAFIGFGEVVTCSSFR